VKHLSSGASRRIAVITPVLCLAGVAVFAVVSPGSSGLPAATPGVAHSGSHNAFGSRKGQLVNSTLHFKVAENSRGQTYGSAAGVSVPSQLPDLIAVVATNGKIGYITKTAFMPTTKSLTLQQVLSFPRTANGNFVAPARTVPVFTSNGTTQIGTFTIGASGTSGNFATSSPAAP
jgi:hypothetical protein